MDVIDLRPAFVDERGTITDLIAHGSIDAVTLITFEKGAVRANHFHRETIQWNYVLFGTIRIVTRMPDAPILERTLRKGDFVVTRENESHALEALEAAEVLILTRGPRAGTDYASDTFRVDPPLIPTRALR